jgi:hypothetical protein
VEPSPKATDLSALKLAVMLFAAKIAAFFAPPA